MVSADSFPVVEDGEAGQNAAELAEKVADW